ncbi:MAG: FAD-dependent oxidoreductase, partial [Acidobacteriota bacterium]
QSCFWLAQRPARTPEPLAGSLEVDVAIIGGGFTGLWAALFVKELAPETSVAVLEQELVGYGASGRNAGIVGETIDHSHELAIAHFGLDEARELARLGRENLDEMEAFLTRRGIDAGWERPGQLTMALTPAHVLALETGRQAAERVGMTDWWVLSREEARAELASPLYLGALLSPRSALVDPVRLVEGLRREAGDGGVRICERTPVTGFAFPRDRVRVASAAGTVTARRVILATNAYTHHLWPGLRKRFLPLYDYVLVSEPLTAEQRRSIGWRNRQGVTDTRTFFNYYRLTRDDRILWGTSEAVYFSGNRIDASCDHSPAHYASLTESFCRHFPALAEVSFPFAWGGPIASTTRLTPFFGSVEGRLSYGLGYTGHGIGSSRVAGKILAHMALERASPLLDLAMVRRPPFPYPPEPLRSLAVAAVTRSLRRVDAGRPADLVLRVLEKMGIGFSS